MVRRLQCVWRLSIRHPLHSRRWSGSSSCWVYLRMILHPSGLYPQRGSSLMTLTKTWWPRCLNLFLKSRTFAGTLNAGWRNWRINQWCTHRWSYEYEDKRVWAVNGQMSQYNMNILRFPKRCNFRRRRWFPYRISPYTSPKCSTRSSILAFSTRDPEERLYDLMEQIWRVSEGRMFHIVWKSQRGDNKKRTSLADLVR